MIPVLTIFIPTFNRNEMLTKCIQSVEKSVKKANICYEIIIVNEAPSEIPVNLNDDNVKILNFKKELLPCYAMYYALLNSHGNYFLRIDDDNEIDINLVKRLYNYISTHNDVAYCGALAKTENGIIANKGTILSKHLKIATRDIKIGNVAYEVDFVDNVYILNRQRINLENFYDSCGFFPWSFEDGYDQLSSRQNGYKIVTLPTAITIHHSHTKNVNLKQVYYYGRSKIIMYKYAYHYSYIVSIFYAIVGFLYLPVAYKGNLNNILMIYKNYLKGIRDGSKYLKFKNDK